MLWDKGDYHKYASFIAEVERHFKIPKNMLALVLYQASEYDPDRIAGKGYNPIGVIGIAKLPKECIGMWEGADMRTDPFHSIHVAGMLLAKHHARFGTWRHALIAYHTDEEITRRYLRGEKPLPIDAMKYVSEFASAISV